MFRAPGRDFADRCAVVLRAVALAALLATIPCGQLRAEDPASLPPAWGCLPEQTMFVLRLPNVAAFADALTGQTRLGAALNDAGRWKEAITFFARRSGHELEEIERRLAAYDLKLEDWRALASAEIGYAWIGDEQLAVAAQGKAIDPDSYLHLVFALWVEPDDELGQRLWKAWDRWTAQTVADVSYLKRFDETLAGRQVIRLAAKDLLLPVDEINFGGGFSGRGLSFYLTNDLPKSSDEQAAPPTDDFHLLVARVGRRFLIVHNDPEEQEDAEQAQAESLASLELCRQVMSGLLERHLAPGEPAVWLRDAVAQTPREGTALFELYCNLSLFFQVESIGVEDDLHEAKNNGEADGYDAFEIACWSMLKPLIAGLGNVIVRGSLHENRLERTVRVGLASERDGPLKMFDTDALPAEPPAWVPATARSYSQINLDVATIAESIRTLLKAFRETKEGAALSLVEGQWQVNFEELISSLGPRLMFVEFADPPEGKQRVGPSDAILWQVRDDQSWQKCLEAAAGSFGLKVRKQDGYVGLKVPLFGKGAEAKKYESSTPWLLAGHGHLLLVIGADPTGPPLTSLPEAAAGGASFRDSQAFKRVAELFPGETCFAFQCTDSSTKDDTKRWLHAWITQLAKLRLIPHDKPTEKSPLTLRDWSKDWWSRLLGDEFEQSLISVEGDRMTIEPNAIVHRSVIELAPPER